MNKRRKKNAVREQMKHSCAFKQTSSGLVFFLFVLCCVLVRVYEQRQWENERMKGKYGGREKIIENLYIRIYLEAALNHGVQ